MDWAWVADARERARRREALWRLLGPRPWRAEGVAGTRLGVHTEDPLRVERWRLDLNAEQAVPALLLRPRDGVPRGVVLYGHAHGHRFDTGKDEVLQGRPALRTPAYGPELAARGWAVLAIDHWGFGERQAPAERALVKRLLWQGATLWGWRLHDTLAALDWLRTQPALSACPVVTLGLSMGGTMALWAAALDERIAACVDLCAAAEYSALEAGEAFDLHAEYFFVPGLRREFSLAEVAALIAPRPHLSLAGLDDPLTPPNGLSSLDREMRAAHAAAGTSDTWRQHVEPGGHAETARMRAVVLDWLSRRFPAGG